MCQTQRLKSRLIAATQVGVFGAIQRSRLPSEAASSAANSHKYYPTADIRTVVIGNVASASKLL
jgi:hypothetical protein